jgi:glycosyltransferase involved in cell wall biosynthesis
LGAGLPVIVPRLAALDDLPDDVTLRYEPGVSGLIDALTRAVALDEPARARRRRAAERFAATRTWAGAAAATRQVYAEVLRCAVPDVGPAARIRDTTAAATR